MTIELVLFVALAALISSAMCFWAFGYALHSQKHRILEMYNRLNYLEVGMNYHELLPMPWERDDMYDDEDKKAFKHEGNVVYLQKEE